MTLFSLIEITNSKGAFKPKNKLQWVGYTGVRCWTRMNPVALGCPFPAALAECSPEHRHHSPCRGFNEEWHDAIDLPPHTRLAPPDDRGPGRSGSVARGAAPGLRRRCPGARAPCSAGAPDRTGRPLGKPVGRPDRALRRA